MVPKDSEHGMAILHQFKRLTQNYPFQECQPDPDVVKALDLSFFQSVSTQVEVITLVDGNLALTPASSSFYPPSWVEEEGIISAEYFVCAPTVPMSIIKGSHVV